MLPTIPFLCRHQKRFPQSYSHLTHTPVKSKKLPSTSEGGVARQFGRPARCGEVGILEGSGSVFFVWLLVLGLFGVLIGWGGHGCDLVLAALVAVDSVDRGNLPCFCPCDGEIVIDLFLVVI